MSLEEKTPIDGPNNIEESVYSRRTRNHLRRFKRNRVCATNSQRTAGRTAKSNQEQR